MKYTAVAAALVATVSAQGIAKVVNRCSYPVYLWSIDKQLGCPEEAGTKLKTGEAFTEELKNGTNGGIAIKISKFSTCGGKDISQLEYYLDYSDGYKGNYLDMSFVDCTKNLEDCPGRTDGFYLKSGDQQGLFKSSNNNEHCPVFNVYNAEEAAKVSYINWDDRQTKFCDNSQDLELYLCGGDAPGAEDETPEPESSATPKPSSSSSKEESAPSPTAKPSKSTKKEPAPTSTAAEEEEEFVIAAAAAVTPAPEVPEVPAGLVVKTEIIYVTKYVDKRHAHVRRHQHFHA